MPLYGELGQCLYVSMITITSLLAGLYNYSDTKVLTMPRDAQIAVSPPPFFLLVLELLLIAEMPYSQKFSPSPAIFVL